MHHLAGLELDLVRRQGRVAVHPLPTLSLTEGEGIGSGLVSMHKGFEISDSDCLLQSQGAVGRLPPPPSVAGWRVGRGWRTLAFPALPGSMLIVSCSSSTIWLAWRLIGIPCSVSEVVGSLGMMIYREAGECGLLAEPIFWPLVGFLVRRQGRVVVHPLPTLSLTEGEGIASPTHG